MQTIATLGHEDAHTALRAMKKLCEARDLAAVLAIADNHGELLAILRLDNAPLASVQIASNKAYTSARERKPSRSIGIAARDVQNGFELSYFGDPKFTGWAGGLPVFIAGQCVGAVGVSGLSEDGDEEIAKVGVQSIEHRISSTK